MVKDEGHESIAFGWWPSMQLVRQSSQADCGLACLAMMLAYYGRNLGLQELRARANLSERGLTLSQLAREAERNGMTTRALRIELHDLRNIQIPAIIHVDGNHFAVVSKVRRRSIDILDPAYGKRSVSWGRFSAMFTGVALEVIPAPNFSPVKGAKSATSLSIFGRVRGIRRTLLWMFLLALVLEVTVALVPLFVQTVVDVVVANRDDRLLGVIAIAYLGLIGAQTVIAGFRGWAIAVAGASLNVGWSRNVFRHLLSLPVPYFQSRQLGDIASRFSGLEAIQRTLSVGAVDAALDGLMAIVTLVILFAYNSTLAIIVLVGLAVYLVLRMIALKMMMEANIDLITATARQETTFIEAVRSAGVIKLNGLMASQSDVFARRVNDVQQKSIKMQSITLVFAGAGTLLFGGIKIATLYYGALATMSGAFSAGMLVAFMAYVDQFTGRSSKLVDFFIGLKLLRVQVTRVLEITSTEPERSLASKYTGFMEVHDIECDGVGFRYGANDEWILKGITLRVGDGEFVGIIGRSGCGKSTLVQLLCGLLDASQGAIRVGGVDVRLLGKERLRELVACVVQDDSLLSGTIEANIAGFAQDYSRDDVVRAATLAGVHDSIMAMPMRYETLIGDMGTMISGGQKQRVCLARALYRRPRILILDEATSSLDVLTESAVAKGLGELSMTRIVVSHRAETLSQAERVYLLDNGVLQMVEERTTDRV